MVRISVTLGEDHVRALDNMASAADSDRSTILRQLIRKRAQEVGAWPETEEGEEDEETRKG